MQKLVDSIQTELERAQGQLPCILGVVALLKGAQAQVHALFPPGSSPSASNSVATIMPYFRDTAHTLVERMAFYLQEAQVRVFSDGELSAIADSLLAHHEIALVMAKDECELVAVHSADQIKAMEEVEHDLTKAGMCYKTLSDDADKARAELARLTGIHDAQVKSVAAASAALDKAKADLHTGERSLDEGRVASVRLTQATEKALDSLRTAERRHAEAKQTFTHQGAQAAKRHKGSGGAH